MKPDNPLSPDLRAIVAGVAAALVVVGGTQAIAAILRIIQWWQS